MILPADLPGGSDQCGPAAPPPARRPPFRRNSTYILPPVERVSLFGMEDAWAPWATSPPRRVSSAPSLYSQDSYKSDATYEGLALRRAEARRPRSASIGEVELSTPVSRLKGPLQWLRRLCCIAEPA